MKTVFLLFIFNIFLIASELVMPTSSYKASGAVIDLVYKNSKLYVATSASCVDIIDEKSKTLKSIKLPKIKDFMGDKINSKIYSVDIYKDMVLILSQAEHGYREISIYKNNSLKKVISVKDKLYVAKAKFLDENRIIFALLSNDVISFDIKNHKNNWMIQASQSKFSNFVLNEKKTKVVIADESGDLKIIDTKNGKVLKVLSGQNLDNVFQVDYKNNIIATAGQDRRVVVYNMNYNSAYYKTSNFLIYSVGLSPSGKFVAYASDENNNVTMFNTSTKSTVATFGGNAMIISNIVFKNEKEFFVASDDKVINFFKVK